MRWLYPVALSLFLAACGGGHAPPDVPPPVQNPPQDPPPLGEACALPAQQEVVRNYMGENYFWYDRLGTPDAAAATISAYFDSLLYKPTDRFSFSEPTSAYEARATIGVRTGYGYTLTWQDALKTVLRVRNVEPQGPAALAGLKRGDRVLSIDGLTLSQVDAGLVPSVDVAGVPRRFVVSDAQGVERTIDMTSAAFPLTLVTAARTFTVHRDGGAAAQVGYLAYQSFAAFGDDALGAAIQSFADAGIEELVLDLRYNGGGSVNVSRELASMIGGSRTAWNLYAYLRFNPQQSARNQSLLFVPPGAPTLPGPALEGVKRLVVITSGSTASASELIVNGLKPFMPVVLVGATTFGKPYGSVVRHHCGTTYSAIHFTTLNSQGEADYQQGMAPDCTVPDDLDHALGDPQEARLAAALHVVRTGQCPVLAPQRKAKALVPAAPVGEVEPAGMYAE
jgi:carboxyl-terminal processing protease